MGRSLKKGPFVDPRLFEKVEKMDSDGRKDPIKTWARRCTIIPEFVGHTFMVHNGRAHVKVFVTEDRVDGVAHIIWASVFDRCGPATHRQNRRR